MNNSSPHVRKEGFKNAPNTGIVDLIRRHSTCICVHLHSLKAPKVLYSFHNNEQSIEASN